MNIQISTGHNTQGNEVLITKFSRTIKSALIRMSDQITIVEVHLKDKDGDKKGKNDKRCMIEAHIEGRQPIVVTERADNLNQALDGAIDKLISMMESILGRQHDQRSRKTEQSASESEFPEQI